MSTFLGPIHFWLYNKIQMQYDNVEELLRLAESVGLTELRDTVEKAYGPSERRPLEEVVDGINIHGWLQKQVTISEYKLAECIKALLNKDENLMKDMKDIFYRRGEMIGKKIAQVEDLTLPKIYKVIAGSLLDGMPCDLAIEIVTENDEEVVWKYKGCTHLGYFKAVDANVEDYYVLRESWIQGYADAMGVDFEKLGNMTYRIKARQ